MTPNHFAHPSGPGVWVALHTTTDDLAAGPFDTFADAVRVMQPATYDDVFIAWVDKAWFTRRDAEIKAELAADDEEEDDDLCPDTGEHPLARCAVEGCQNYRDELEALAPAWTSGRGLKDWAS